MRAVFMGTPDFGVPALKVLAEIATVVGVITRPDRPSGRGRHLQQPPVKMLAQELRLPIAQPELIKSGEAHDILRDWRPDVTVVAAYGQILPESILNIPGSGSVNVHASLLPRWRGAAPVQAAILHGDQVTGVTLMKMDPGLDTGPIIAARQVRVPPDTTGGDLTETLAELGGRLLRDALPRYVQGEIEPYPQDDSLATYAPMLKKSDGLLDANNAAEFLARKVRAYQPWPGTHLFIDGSRLAIHEADVLEGPPSSDPGVPGRIGAHDGYPLLICYQGALLLKTVQPAGKSPMSGSDYLRGAPGIVGRAAG